MKMNVRDLIEMLQDYDEDAEVFIMEQPNWPFEYSVIGVISRSEFEKDEDNDKDSNDVFLLEGRQLRYGNKNAWNEV
jgi:hypothetical protein